MPASLLMRRLGRQDTGLPLLDLFTRGDAAFAAPWTGATFAVSSNAAVNTPTPGADAVTNGAFAADTDWTKGAGWTIAAGTAIATAASANLTAAVAPLTVGTWYQTAFTQGGFAAGTANVLLGSTAFPTHATNATFTETGRALTTALAMTGVGLTDTIDNLSAKALTLAELFASRLTGAVDVNAAVNVTGPTGTAGIQAGLVLNLDSAASPANFVIAYLDGLGNALLDKCVAGVYTNVISAAITYSAGAVLRVIKSGGVYSLFYNSLAVGTPQIITNPGIVSNVRHGLFATTAGSSLDNFSLS